MSGAFTSERNTLIPDSWAVDDAVFDQGVAVTGFHWLCLMSPKFEPIAADFIVLTDSFGKVAVISDLPYERQLVGEAFGLDVWNVALGNLSVQLSPGRYYFGGRPVGTGSYRAFTADKDTVNGATEAYFRSKFLGFPDWTSIQEVKGDALDLVFQVDGDVVPEPGPFVALVGGLILVALRTCGRRRME